MVNIQELWQELADQVTDRLKRGDLSMEDLQIAGQIMWNLQEVVNKQEQEQEDSLLRQL